MTGKSIELDPVLDALKPLGKYQVVQTLLFFISYFSCSYSLFAIIFTGQKAKHSCAPGLNATSSHADELNGDWNNETVVHYGKCSITYTRNDSSGSGISGVIHEDNRCIYGMQYYDKAKDFSVITEFDLVCGRAPLAGLSQTLLMLGQGLGAVLFTALSDRFGRKRIQVITHALLLGGNLVIGFAPDYVTFAVFKLFVGAVQQGVVLTTVTANVESFPGRYRGFIAGFVGAVCWAIVTSSLTPWAYLLRGYSWRVLQLATTSVGVVVILQMIYLREPMRWLLANGRSHEVVEQLKRAAKVNKRSVQEILDVFHHLHREQEKNVTTHPDDVITHPDDVRAQNDDINAKGDDVAEKNVENPEVAPLNASLLALEAELEEVKARKLNCLDLLRHRRLRVNALCVWAIWFINSLTYFALFLMSGSLTDNIYLSFFLNVAVEVPASIIFLFSIERIGRKRTLLLFHIIAAVGLLSSGVLISFSGTPGIKIAATVMTLIGKLGISGSFGCVFFYTNEIFPTNIRNLAVGTGSTAARVGGMIAPFIGLLAEKAVWAPGALFGTCNLLVVVIIRLLPESKGRELPQTIDDLEAWYNPPENNEGEQKSQN
ncbi:organic cation transporter protein-like [Littorina saxatilis]|uniref:organic cation transporter protein-like n=1 Tax=Littorina saxatilis TaxID=31220 RepID=UPI0038B42CC5